MITRQGEKGEKQKKNVSVKPNKTHKPMILTEDKDRSNSFNPEK